MLPQLIIFASGFLFALFLMLPLLNSRNKRVRSLKKEAAELIAGTANFRENMAKLTASLKESAKAISVSGQDSIISGKDQTGSIEKTEATIDENTKIAAEIAVQTNSVAVIASKMEDDVLNGFKVLEKNVKKMTDIKEKNFGVINGIILLSNKVNKIRDIVRAISAITDQTKVIAFNAALEAASAGEAGKRFAVVSGEVNRLADNIAGLTRQIREQIEEIMSSSSFLIVYSEEGSDRIAEGYKLIKDLENIFMDIRSGAEITSNQAQVITVSTQQQLKTSEQIYSGIAEISRRIRHFVRASESTSAKIGTLTEQASELEQFITGENIPAGQDEYGN